MGGYTQAEDLLKAAEKAQGETGRSSYWFSIDWGELEEYREYLEACDPWTIAWLCRHAIKTGIKME